jgi:hypothetical protein
MSGSPVFSATLRGEPHGHLVADAQTRNRDSERKNPMLEWLKTPWAYNMTLIVSVFVDC